MIWNKHSDLEGKHSFLSPSKYTWINYDEGRLVEAFNNFNAAQRGTELHAFAASAIKFGQKLQANHTTLSLFVNDAIGFKMTPEQPLYYSSRCFGTADAICFRKNLLRIHDLKTGTTPAHMEQLEIYAALFCLEYNRNPEEIQMELRLYQNNAVIVEVPEPKKIKFIMDKAVLFTRILDEQDRLIYSNNNIMKG